MPAFTPSQLARTAAPKEEVLFDLELERRYHDEELLQQAPFVVEFEDGNTMTGTLSAAGVASKKQLAVRPVRVRFQPDARVYETIDNTNNPDFNGAGGSPAARRAIRKTLGG